MRAYNPENPKSSARRTPTATSTDSDRSDRRDTRMQAAQLGVEATTDLVSIITGNVPDSYVINEAPMPVTQQVPWVPILIGTGVVGALIVAMR